jgi:predicted transcriptional regulator
LLRAVDATGSEAGAPEPAYRLWGHDELLAARFAPVTWAVDRFLLVGGLTVLGGKKKLGKSWLCLQIAQAVACGCSVLNRKTTQGSVLYLALEDGERRIRERLQMQSAPSGLPIKYVARFPSLDNPKGMAVLGELVERERPLVLIVDPLAAAKTRATDENDAGQMGDLFNGLRRLAQDANCGVVVVHHHGKSEHGDPGFDLRGSSAVAGAVDASLGLYKKESGHELLTEGRDIGAETLAVEFDAGRTWCWHLRGDANELRQEESEGETLTALRELGECSVDALVQEVGKSRPQVQKTLHALRQAGRVTRSKDPGDKRGQRFLYCFADEHSEAVEQHEQHEQVEHHEQVEQQGADARRSFAETCSSWGDLFTEATNR